MHPHPDISVGSEFEDMTECGEIYLRLMQDLTGNYCFHFIRTFAWQAISMAFMSVFMTIFGICSYMSVM
jgi:hypothetical protein